MAVVLPDEPGQDAAENCPGSRYMFGFAMLCGGVPADYLLNKLLTHQALSVGLDAYQQPFGFDGLWESPGRHLSPWQKEAVKRLYVLATHLSDELQSAAHRMFGADYSPVAWSRQTQWQLQKSRRQGANKVRE